MTRNDRSGVDAVATPHGSSASTPGWLWPALAALFLFTGAYAWRLIPNPDISWLLLCAERWLGGASYGADAMEVNPPLIVWIYSIAVVAAGVADAQLHHALVVQTLVVVAGALAVTAAIIRRISPRWPLVILALAAAVLLLPGTDFSQREHFAAALVLPWAALAAARIANVRLPRPLLVSAAVLGTLGLIVKPYFLLAWLGMEAAVLSRTRGRALLRTENLIAIAIGVAYILASVLLMPDYFTLAEQLRPLYPVYLRQRETDALLVSVFCLALAVLLLRRAELRPLTLTFALGALGFSMAGAIQMKWFGYHFLPAMVMMGGAAATLRPFVRARSEWRRSSLPPAALQVLVAWILVVSASRAVSILAEPLAPQNLGEPHFEEMRDFIRREAPGGTVVTLSTNIQSGFPVVPLSGARWGFRLPSLWPLFAVYYEEFWEEPLITFRPPAERTDLERWFTDVVYEDLTRYEPDIIFIMKYDPVLLQSGGARRFDYEAYFTAEKRFRAVFSRYRRTGDVGRYSVLVRRSEASADGN